MKIMTNYSNAIKGLLGLLKGLKITGVEFFKPQLTIHYPRKEVTNLATYRGHIDLVAKEDAPLEPKCIICGKCAEVCPSACISMEMHVKGEQSFASPAECRTITVGHGIEIPFSGLRLPPAEVIERELDSFNLDYNYCSLCGLCVQICPVGSLTFSKDSYLAGTARKNFEFDLLQRLRERSRRSSQTTTAQEKR